MRIGHNIQLLFRIFGGLTKVAASGIRFALSGRRIGPRFGAMTGIPPEQQENQPMPQKQATTSKPLKVQNIFGQPLTIFGLPVERDIIFSDSKGTYKKRIEKQQRRLLVKTTFIKFFLQDDERILCLTTGYSPVSILEQILTGPAFLFFKRAYFIFTDRRILHIPTRFNQSSRSAISQISYDDCSMIHLKGRSLIVTYKNNKQECFHYLGRREKKKIGALLKNITPKLKEAGSLQQRVYLCPSCTNILKAREFICPTCKMVFKSSAKANLTSLLIPGGGYFYNHYTFPGILVGLLDSALIICLAYRLSSLNAGMPANTIMIAVLLGSLIIEKFITTYHAGHLIEDFIPEKKNYTQRKI
jgi:acetone carboxylase gamma subunit